ncbi:HNH endonuclease [Clostridium cellulovorans]|uniref:HNH endonuclease n=1 Tax=Clostridium cellulovorans (strain ATCC 35296 / DSM 3052 / OCM 3 / 743B) TaxID=573061 RepID=D9SSE4_CLOC7|nr:HNH endonuclease [Clostridium cellulovorans]ADL50541.1 HNH endonuclease [Clostridium cellulovorans 743B]
MKAIPGYHGYYATEDAQIISIRSGTERILSQRMHKGYLHVQIRKGIGRDTKVKVPVHQLVLATFKGQRKSNELVCRHLNGNPLDNRIENLEWGTVKDNCNDSIRHGTAACLRQGEKHPCSKIKNSTVVEIKHLINEGLSNRAIADMFSLKTYNINDIRAGKAWSHL